MKVIIVSVVALLLSACATTSKSTNQPKVTKKFLGTINTSPVEMVLQQSGNKLSGSYYWVKVQPRRDFDLIGEVDAQGNVIMNDLDSDNKKIGTFKGTLTADSLNGQWSSLEQEGNIKNFSLRSAGVVADTIPMTTPPPTLSLNDQAIAEARRVFEETAFTKCNESYYSMDSALGATYGGGMATGIAPRRNPRYEVETTYPITEADKFNEITWKGTVILKFDAIRYYKNGTWVDWRPYQPLKMYELTVNKRGGKWVTDTPYILNHAQSKVSCSDVPH